MTGFILAAAAAFTFGSFEIDCPRPDGWKIDVTREVASDGAEIAKIVLDAPTPRKPPRFSAKIATAQVDFSYQWTVNDRDFQLFPNWGGAKFSDIAGHIPVYVFMNGNDTSRFAVAASECVRPVVYEGGICEEGSWLLVSLKYFDDIQGDLLTHYETRIRIDAKDRYFGDAVRESVSWIDKTNGFDPLPVPESAFDPLYSTWYCFHRNVNARAIEEECAIAAKLGIKTLIVDDGWETDNAGRSFGYAGDWHVSTNKFPDFRAHVRKVRDMGFKYMAWYSVPFVGHETANFERFKGKYLQEEDSGMAAALLDPRLPDVRRYLVETYVAALKDSGLDGLKLDFIDSMRYAGRDDPALKDDYAGRDFRSVPLAIEKLMGEIRTALTAVRPDLLIEFRQTYVGPAVRRYGNILRVADCPGDMRRNRFAIANLRLAGGDAAVHSDMLEWHVTEPAEKSALFVLNSIFGVVQYSVMLREAPKAHLDMLRHWIAFSQEHRHALLHGEFRPHHPELMYPLVEAEDDAERIIGVYDDGRLTDCGPADKPVYVINATGREGLALKLAAACDITSVDVFGRVVDRRTAAAGLVSLPCPESGYLKVEPRRAATAGVADLDRARGKSGS